MACSNCDGSGTKTVQDVSTERRDSPNGGTVDVEVVIYRQVPCSSHTE